MNVKSRYAFLGIGLFLILLFGCAGPSGPKPATGLMAKAVQNGIALSWSPSPSADVAGYNIYRSTTSGELGTKINGGLLTGVSYTDTTGLNDGSTYYYTIRAVNSRGIEEQNKAQASALAQTAPPSALTISINDGATFSVIKTVTITTSAYKATDCRFANSLTDWGSWETYTTRKVWDMTDGDSLKTIYYQCRNAIGTESESVNSSITLKTTKSAVSITTPADGDILSTHLTVGMKVTNTLGQVKCNGYIDDSLFVIGTIPDGSIQSFPLVLRDGGHSGYIECTDNTGTFKSNMLQVTTEENPTSFTINGGAGYTDSTSVTLNIFAPSAAQCRYSNDGVTYSGWDIFVKTKAWSLTNGVGLKTVYLECKSQTGNSLGVVSDKITLKNAPRVSLSINNDESVTTSRTVRLSIYSPTATDCRYSDGGVDYTDWGTYITNRNYILPNGDGLKTIYIQCRDSTNSIGSGSASITLRQKPQNPPTSLSILINGGADRTSSRDVTLTLDAYNGDSCRYRNEDSDWSGFTSFTYRRSWTLSSGTGTKTVYYQCQNDNGRSDVKSATIRYGSSQPAVSIITPQDGGTYSEGTIPLQFIAYGDGSLVCTYYCNGVANNAGRVQSGGTVTRTLLTEGSLNGCGVPGVGSEFTTSVSCTDDSGQSAGSGTNTFTWTKWVGPLKEDTGPLLGG